MGKNVPLEQATPAEQNQVAYSRIEKLKSEGYGPAQIASMWNAGTGEPNAYTGTFSNGQPSEGTNSYGVKYNVPAYVNGVMKNYANLTQSSTNTGSTQQVSATNTQISPLDVGAAAVAGGAGILSKLWTYFKAPLSDAAKSAVTGAITGETIDPAGGGIPGAIAGGAAGIGEGIISDLTGGAKKSSSSTDTTGTTGTSGTAGTTDTTTPPATPPPSSNTEETTRAADASQMLKDAISPILEKVQGGRNLLNTQAGQNMLETAATFGLVNNTPQGTATFNSPKLAKMEGQVENAKDALISETGSAPVSVATMAPDMASYIMSDRLNTQADRQKAVDIASKELQADSHGTGEMTLSEMRQAQKEHNRAAQPSFKNPRPSAEMLAHKAISDAYGKAIRSRISKEDLPLYDKLSEMSKDLTQVKGLKKYIEGKKLTKTKGIKERILRAGAQAAELYIGDKIGGPVGAVLAGMAGEHLNRRITAHYGANMFETKGMKKALKVLKETEPSGYKFLMQQMKERGVKVPEVSEDETKKAREKNVAYYTDMMTASLKKRGIVPPPIKKEETLKKAEKTVKRRGLVNPKTPQTQSKSKTKGR